jgi:hypothetical protein
MARKMAAKRPIGGEGTGVMYAFLLALGAAITAAGLALVAPGVSLQARAFDVNAATPGIIAIIGGCVLIGLSLVVRALLRVERALTARAAARPAPADETSAKSATGGTGEPPVALPSDVKTAAEASTEAVAAEQAPIQTAAERIERAPVVDAGDVSLLPKEPTRADEDRSVSQGGVSNGKLNGASHTTMAPRLAGGPGRRPQPKNSIFDTLWPKASASAAVVQPAPAAQPVAAAASVQPAQSPAEPTAAAPAATAHPSQTAASVSILKSGVVEGMAYTLYSDGSIEAQLPGGTMRFSSITDLRSHIEQNG